MIDYHWSKANCSCSCVSVLMRWLQARERREELQKLRALISYQETKARRRGKIKSKRLVRAHAQQDVVQAFVAMDMGGVNGLKL